MAIIPSSGKVFVKPYKTDLGAFQQVDSRVSERGKVAYVAEDCNWYKQGDEVYFKAWGMDSVEIDNELYFVADIDRKNLLCKIQ